MSGAAKVPDAIWRHAHKSNAGRWFDIFKSATHHDFVRSPARTTVLLVAAVLLAWHGVLLATPHNHADTTVPQEVLACSASHSSSQTNHLHGSGRLLSPHPCLACLAGTTVIDTVGISGIGGVVDDQLIVVAASPDLRARFHTRLPPLRGPPLTI
jgi:hypothetical protein